MADIGRQIRELFDEVADPIDIREIVARERRRGWRGWQIALAAGVAALLIVGGVVLLHRRTFPISVSTSRAGS
jgi:hypothetical protein